MGSVMFTFAMRKFTIIVAVIMLWVVPIIFVTIKQK